MAKKSMIMKNLRRQKMAASQRKKRTSLRNEMRSLREDGSLEQLMELSQKMAALPRNGAKNRVRLRCELTGRPRGVYRKLRVCRMKLRELANSGQIPGMVKASW